MLPRGRFLDINKNKVPKNIPPTILVVVNVMLGLLSTNTDLERSMNEIDSVPKLETFQGIICMIFWLILTLASL